MASGLIAHAPLGDEIVSDPLLVVEPGGLVFFNLWQGIKNRARPEIRRDEHHVNIGALADGELPGAGHVPHHLPDAGGEPRESLLFRPAYYRTLAARLTVLGVEAVPGRGRVLVAQLDRSRAERSVVTVGRWFDSEAAAGADDPLEFE